MSTAYAIVALNVLCIFICYMIAKKRGGNLPFWAAMGALFGPLAIPFVFFSGKKT